MKFNLHIIVAISCLGSPLASIAQSPVLPVAGPHLAPAPSVTVAGRTNAPIPWNQIGVKAGADYRGDGLAVTPNGEGARLHCVFQRLDGEATPEGLWLTSTVTNTPSDRFRVTAMAVGRVTPCAPGAAGAADRTSNSQHPISNIQLEDVGIISLAGQTVRLSRPGFVEEYSVSMDGVRQDFVVPERPAGAGELTVRLTVSGARVEPAAAGTQLVLDHSGRKIAYSRLRVTDATGKELPARIEVAGRAGSPLPAAMGDNTDSGAHGVSRPTLVVVVNDEAAIYPVRIDPTFSDANWISMGGMNSFVYALAMSGNDLYVGGTFTTAGGIAANYIAQWNGSSWSQLGSGMYGAVFALAVSGSTLYAGGTFTTAGGNLANCIAQWNGSSWSALGSGFSGNIPDGDGPVVNALAVSGSTLYAAGNFTNAGGVSAVRIAKWNGSSWSALGSGVSGESPYGGHSYVAALAVSGSDLYVGGVFTNAGGVAANYIAKWDGSSWSALGSGMNVWVNALAVSGSMLYAGGSFKTAGGIAAYGIAKWDGNSWSALGSGISGTGTLGEVNALAVSGSDLYAGGEFTTAGGIAATNIAKWDGSSWSALGSGTGGLFGGDVNALVSGTGSDLYVGGEFTMAGGKVSADLARAILRLPALTLWQTNSSTVAVSWPSPSPGFVLQQNTAGLGFGNWSKVTDAILDDGTNKMITQPMGTNSFFRLVLP